MADSIRPWLSEHLIDNGERFGGDLAAAPLFTKKKKVQLIEFLTYGLTTQDDCIWAKVSDKQYKIPVRFSSAAVSEYNRANRKRLTEHKTAVISIKDFKPFFARVPLGHKRGMSEKACLALEVNHVVVIGSIGEGQWGSPQEVEMNNELRLWSEGLRQHGGGGNILKEKKNEREQGLDANVTTKSSLCHERTSIPLATKRRVYAASRVSEHKSIDKVALVPGKVNLLKEYERSWRPIYEASIWKPGCLKEAIRSSEGGQAAVRPLSSEKKVTEEHSNPQRARPIERPTRPTRNVLDLDSSQPETTPFSPKPSPKSQIPLFEKQTTPLPEEWPPSVRGTPDVEHVSSEEDDPSECEQSFSSPLVNREYGSNPHPENNSPSISISESSVDLTPPTPGQRQKPYIPEPSSSPPASSGARSARTSDHPTSPTSLLLSRSGVRRRQVARKVPYPSQPFPPNPSFSGPPRVLVPNSDTSQSQSQSQSQLQQPLKLASRNPLSCTQEEDVMRPADKDESDVGLFGSQPDSYDGDKHLLNQSIAIKDEPDLDDEPGPWDDNNAMTANFGSSSQNIVTGNSAAEGESGSNEEVPCRPLLDNAKSQIKEGGSVVPDSQEDQLDDDDAQIDEALFGNTHSDAISNSAIEFDSMPIVNSPVPDGLANIQNAPADASRKPSESQVQAMPTTQPQNPRQPNPSSLRSSPICRTSPSPGELSQSAAAVVRPLSVAGKFSRDVSVRAALDDHDSEAWKMPTFMRSTDNMGKGKERAISSNVSENKRGHTTSEKIGDLASSKGSNGVTRTAVKKLQLGQSSQSRRSSLGSSLGSATNNHRRHSSSSTHLENRPSGAPNGGSIVTPSSSIDLVGERDAKGPRIDLLIASRRQSKRTREILLDDSLDDKNAAEPSRKKRKVVESTSNGNSSSSRRSGNHEKRYVMERGRVEGDAAPKGHVDGNKLVGIKDAQAEETVGPSAKTKSAGFNINFENFRPNLPFTTTYNETEPPWFSWQMLTEVLLRTGRHRSKQEAAKAKAKVGL